MEPVAGPIADPQRRLAPELLAPAVAILARTDCSIQQPGSQHNHRCQVNHVQSQRHLGESFPGTGALLPSDQVAAVHATAVPPAPRPGPGPTALTAAIAA